VGEERDTGVKIFFSARRRNAARNIISARPASKTQRKEGRMRAYLLLPLNDEIDRAGEKERERAIESGDSIRIQRAGTYMYFRYLKTELLNKRCHFI